MEQKEIKKDDRMTRRKVILGKLENWANSSMAQPVTISREDAKLIVDDYKRWDTMKLIGMIVLIVLIAIEGFHLYYQRHDKETSSKETRLEIKKDTVGEKRGIEIKKDTIIHRKRSR